ncbi:hypothetical protein [Streptococcus saliviloxodontae]|uniref:Uncharacterized protein n=1 Tax=Streptococcus saliviloxodontae TaxID=1349416 RepID=A0ABS2PKN0_9STRE|nr:hypothetical protein [Streptococcus saliviloxodontae]MBM7635989.1 hypothetical protein [Streptococcus saliviloxodontae]
MSASANNSHKLLVRTLTISLHYLGLFEDELNLIVTRPSVLSPLLSPIVVRDDSRLLLAAFSKITKQRELIKSSFWYDNHGFYLLNESLNLVETWTDMIDDLIYFSYTLSLIQGILREGKKRNYGILINNLTSLIEINDSLKAVNDVYRSHDALHLDSERILSYLDNQDSLIDANTAPQSTPTKSISEQLPLSVPRIPRPGDRISIRRPRNEQMALMSSEELERSLVQSISESLASSEHFFQSTSQSIACSESLALRETVDLSYTFMGVRSVSKSPQTVVEEEFSHTSKETFSFDQTILSDVMSAEDLVGQVKHCLFDLAPSSVFVIDPKQSLKGNLSSFLGFKSFDYLDQDGVLDVAQVKSHLLANPAMAYIFYPSQLIETSSFSEQLQHLKASFPNIKINSFLVDKY